MKDLDMTRGTLRSRWMLWSERGRMYRASSWRDCPGCGMWPTFRWKETESICIWSHRIIIHACIVSIIVLASTDGLRSMQQCLQINGSKPVSPPWCGSGPSPQCAIYSWDITKPPEPCYCFVFQHMECSLPWIVAIMFILWKKYKWWFF